jgi:hypothetical protein
MYGYERDDADEPFVPIEYRKTPHLMSAITCAAFSIIVLEKVTDAFRRNLSQHRIAG